MKKKGRIMATMYGKPIPAPPKTIDQPMMLLAEHNRWLAKIRKEAAAAKDLLFEGEYGFRAKAEQHIDWIVRVLCAPVKDAAEGGG